MKRLDLWRWRYFDPIRDEWAITRIAMDQADAKLQFPDGAEKVEGTHTTRWVPDDSVPIIRPVNPPWIRSRRKLRLSVSSLLGCAEPRSGWAHEQAELNSAYVMALLDNPQPSRTGMLLA